MIASGRSSTALLAIAALSLSACSVSEGNSAQEAVTPEPAATSGVVREEVRVEEPTVQRMAPIAVIQSQPGPDGSQVDLIKAAVTGDILTVTLRCSSEERHNGEIFRVSQISIIDDATSQRIGVLKDNEGNAMVSSLVKGSNRDNDYVRADCETRPGVIWAKFPAPPATTQTISINFPEVGPFDGVPVMR